jgi:hypothetical protein
MPRGRQQKPDAERRTYPISCALTCEEIAKLDAQRGGMGRGAYLREAAFGNPPPVVPAINKEAWVDLSRSASNLNQIARRLNSGDALKVDEILIALASFRSRLLSQ